MLSYVFKAEYTDTAFNRRQFGVSLLLTLLFYKNYTIEGKGSTNPPDSRSAFEVQESVFKVTDMLISSRSSYLKAGL